MIRQILPPDYLKTFEPLQVTTLQVKPQNLKTILDHYRTHEYFNSEKLSHLKRVKAGRILLCLTQDINEFDLSYVKQIDPNYLITEASVSKHKPFTLSQFKEWSVYWPLYFFNNQDEQIQFSISQLKIITNMFDHLKQEAQGSSYRYDACAVVHPDTNEMLGSAQDLSSGKSINHPIMNLLKVPLKKQQLKDYQGIGEDEDHYYLTGLDVYVVEEPCPMCAMALIHSRVRRVFYLKKNELGALNEKLGIHCLPSLNHHYKAFQYIE